VAERSLVARLRAEIGDYKAKMTEAANLTKKVGEVTEQANKKASDSDKVRAAVRKQAADAEIRSNEQLLIATEKYGKSSAMIDAHSASISKLSNTALGLGAAVGVGVGATARTFADFDKQMSSVAATGSDARTHIDELRKSAIDLGAASSFSASEAAAGVENLLKAGVSAADVMGGGLKGSLDLAAAGSMTVGDAAETAATALTQFKLSGKDVPHVADLLAAGAGKAQGEVSDMGQALNQSGLVASQFGLSIEDTTGTLAAFASAGLVGSDAGTSFRTMLLALANPSDKARESMHKLGIAAYDANDQFVGISNLAGQLRDKMGGLTQAQRDQALAQIFGNDAIRAANVLFEQGATGYRLMAG
jgi:TP901 family phage tail tape measure protein